MKRLLLCTALLLPITLLSCDDSKTPTETSIDPATDIDVPSLTTVGFGSKWHDPHIVGVTVYCFSGAEDAKADPTVPYGGDCKRFRSKDGVEVKTNSGDPDGEYAGFYGKKNLIKGRLLDKVKELDFSYAGGAPSGGSPRFSIPIDECEVRGEGTVGEYPCTTDGDTEGYVFADVTESSGCNDGDGFVGVLNGEDDETCLWYYRNEIAGYANWAAFAAAHPGWRIATDAVPFAIIDQPGHYLLFKWDVR